MIVDLNCAIGRWPFRTYGAQTPAELDAMLESEGIERAYPSSIDAMLVTDPEEPNVSLFDGAAAFPRLNPIPVVNPRLRQWRSMLDQFRNEREVFAVKIHPTYHGYSLGNEPDPRGPGPGLTDHADELAEYLTEAAIPLLISIRVLDDRYHPQSLKVPPVPAADIAEFSERHPRLSIVCLNGYLADVRSLADCASVAFDIASVEYFRTLDSALAIVPRERLVLGTNAPFYVPRAAVMKLVWSEAASESLDEIAGGNAERLCG